MHDCSAFPEWKNKMGYVGLPYQESVQGTADIGIYHNNNNISHIMEVNCFHSEKLLVAKLVKKCLT